MCSVDNVHRTEKPYIYTVDSDTGIIDRYEVIVRKDGSYHCDCKAFRYQSSECKHIAAVREYRAQQQTPPPYLTTDMTYAELGRALLSMKGCESLVCTVKPNSDATNIDLHMSPEEPIKGKDGKHRKLFGE